jgi:hypothetical protein
MGASLCRPKLGTRDVSPNAKGTGARRPCAAWELGDGRSICRTQAFILGREQISEAVRADEFPNKPRRFEAAFAFMTEQGARWWRAHERQGAILYEVEPIDPTMTSHVGDMSGVQQIANVDPTPEAAARRY